MGGVIDLTGRAFGRWSVLGLSHQVGNVLYWSCRCECGTERAVFGGDLKRGGSLSCGCLPKELLTKNATTHGMARHPAYRSWIYMRDRCLNPKSDSYPLYGGRGIRVCERWESFADFWKDMGATWGRGLSIDRIDVNGHYEPGNCRWATPFQQAQNRRTNRIIKTPRGPMNVAEAARSFGISYDTLQARLRYGWTDEELLLPVRGTTDATKAGNDQEQMMR